MCDTLIANARQQLDGNEATEAAGQVCRRHNYQIKAPITADKVINTLKQEVHEALAGAYLLVSVCVCSRDAKKKEEEEEEE